MSPSSRVAVVLLNWRNATDTLACIESVLCSRYPDYSILVCDNASGDASLEAFLAWAKARPGVAADFVLRQGASSSEVENALRYRVAWIDTGANLGFAGGNNVALRLALAHGEYRYFWLLNNDCVVAPDAMGALVARMGEDEGIGICGALLRYFDPPQSVQAYGGARHNPWTGRGRYLGHLATPGAGHDPRKVEETLSYVAGASMFVRREFVERVGLMSEEYFLYFEEIDWAMRAGRRFRLGYAPEAVVFHKEGATIGSSSDTRRTSALSDFYLFRNRLRFTRKFFPAALPAVWTVMLLQALKRGLRGQMDRAWLILTILFGRKAL